ncbi:Uncharacterized protein dnm_035700 [Desulfonema magnum]|uniref:Uncharacterized protein n=1 Tax=Desulfonema magnum TaxID=45655 RepID=A0A975GN15_9BACT|nr:Uncharacterized protein dnm_035700 [Desulfonema magnum]
MKSTIRSATSCRTRSISWLGFFINDIRVSHNQNVNLPRTR